MKTHYVARAVKFIKLFFSEMDNPKAMREPWLMQDQVVNFNLKHNRNVHCNNGVSRIALISSDYVVKWDRNPKSCDSENELNFYRKACDDGMNYLFAQITPFDYNGVTFYIMPRCVTAESRHKMRWWDYVNDDEYDYISDNIEDLHVGNWGFDKEGHMIIFDYACNWL